MNNEIATQEISGNLAFTLFKFLTFAALVILVFLVPTLIDLSPTAAKWILGIVIYFVAQFAVGVVVGRAIRQRD